MKPCKTSWRKLSVSTTKKVRYCYLEIKRKSFQDMTKLLTLHWFTNDIWLGNGYITTAVLREILAALDDKLTPEDLDGIIEEIDEDGSGTIDFDGKLLIDLFNIWFKECDTIITFFYSIVISLEFMEMMTGWIFRLTICLSESCLYYIEPPYHLFKYNLIMKLIHIWLFPVNRAALLHPSLCFHVHCRRVFFPLDYFHFQWMAREWCFDVL